MERSAAGYLLQRRRERPDAYFSSVSTAMKASCGISTWPTIRIRFLPAFCFSNSLRFRDTVS